VSQIQYGPVSCAVLIVGYRAYDVLERCLTALEPWLGPDDEVVVVDHESDEAQLRRAIARCPRAVAIPRADNPGFAAGVNLARQHSRAPYLLLLNPDAELLGPVPRVLEAYLRDHPEIGIVGPRVLDPTGTVQGSARRFPEFSTILGGRSTWLTRMFPGNPITARNVIGRDATSPIFADWVAGACLMTSRELFDRLGGLDEKFFLYWEDADYCLRAAAIGARCVYNPTVAVRHSGGASAHYLLARAIREFHRSAFLYFQKHCHPAVRPLAPLVRAGLRVRGELRLRRALKHPDLVHAPVPAGKPQGAIAPVTPGLEPERSQ
jgi:N-acetylglucosaminyl-diphospho-decaprenol L-rhamnosyltransferase